ncbi:1,4-dihydroxy-6-naphthoate synthase [Geopsychrobacter electrodiphilus]|uniref:1,4-dihydroxy-6-naphthoate synthase n=1 Tax=Geopsychrobacter electrodiphilus TaxID=225196 RepID=UPI00036F34D9|nr:1,4-dihydroxy-6-naphthoate synthase [Geopsychrobacter electrodiphilus]
MQLTLGYSPCPNDTFIFHALSHGLVEAPFRLQVRHEDVETLNQLARQSMLDLTKISYHAFGHLRDQYCLLRAGGALGRGCGPLVVAKRPMEMRELVDQTIAIPGELTTANLLLQLHGEGYRKLKVMSFEQIMSAVALGEVAAGVIIHESRFTFAEQGLVKLLDLGDWWEQETGHPIPLGGILAKRNLGKALINAVDDAIGRSLDYAWAHPRQATAYICAHAQEMDEAVMRQHIELYVNQYSRDLGDAGVAAVEDLFARAEKRGLIPGSSQALFV